MGAFVDDMTFLLFSRFFVFYYLFYFRKCRDKYTKKNLIRHEGQAKTPIQERDERFCAVNFLSFAVVNARRLNSRLQRAQAAIYGAIALTRSLFTGHALAAHRGHCGAFSPDTPLTPCTAHIAP